MNGKIEKGSYKLKNEDEVTIILSEDLSIIIEPENIPLDIVYEHENMLVVNMPKEMLTHPTTKETKGTKRDKRDKSYAPTAKSNASQHPKAMLSASKGNAFSG